jgi:hypothetical protein
MIDDGLKDETSPHGMMLLLLLAVIRSDTSHSALFNDELPNSNHDPTTILNSFTNHQRRNREVFKGYEKCSLPS